MVTRSLKTQPFRSQRILKPSTPSRNRKFKQKGLNLFLKWEEKPSIHGNSRIKCIHHTKDFPAKAEEKVPVFRNTKLHQKRINRENMKAWNSPTKAYEHILVLRHCQTWPINSKRTNLIESISHLQQVHRESCFQAFTLTTFLFFFLFFFLTPATCKLSLAPKGSTSDVLSRAKQHQ